MVATATSILFDEVPGKYDNWDKIKEFALSFEPYLFNDNTGDIANDLFNSYRRTGQADFESHELGELKSALFFEYKRYRHLETNPEALNLEYINKLTGVIRKQLIEDHFRFRKPVFRFSISRTHGDSFHLLSDGVHFFVYTYRDVFPGLGDCRITRPGKELMNKLNSFLLANLESWEKSYENHDRNDETQWELKVNIKGLNKKVSGLNEFPEGWEEMLEKISEVVEEKIS